MVNKIIQGDALEVLKTLPNEAVDCVITSPPYWGLRDYGVEGQLGLESTPEEYVERLVEIFRESKRVLKKEGTCWLNLGDSYVSGKSRYSSNEQTLSGKGRGEPGQGKKPDLYYHPFLKDKDLAGIPWRVDFALQADGWYLRQDIIWNKPNVMPESVKYRCTKNHEYIFLLAKSQNYYFDIEAIKEKSVYTDNRLGKGRHTYNGKRQGEKGTGVAAVISVTEMRNKRSVWTITTKPFKDAHFATFPEDLVVPMIKASCPEFVCKKCGKAREKIKEIGLTDCGCNAGFGGGICLDPFFGSGTTGVVAKKLNRNYLGIELNPAYVKMAEKRLQAVNPLF